MAISHPIYIGAPRNILKLRAELVEKTESHQVNTPDPYDSLKETIHGDAGDAILIQQKLVYNGRGAERYFYHCLWHEFGHYFAIYNESKKKDVYGASALHRYNDPGLAGEVTDLPNLTALLDQAKLNPTNLTPKDEVALVEAAHKILLQQDKMEGYWFWSEFIAESIANYVEEEYCRIDNADAYHPEQITWEPDDWGFLPDKLMNFLEMGFSITRNPSTRPGLPCTLLHCS